MKREKFLKSVALILALLMIASAVAILPVVADAAEEEFDVWDGTVDTSWLPTTGTKREFEIDTAEKLAGLAQLVNQKKSSTGAYTGYTFYITKNIDLGYLDWAPIGNGTDGKSAFGGSLIGKLNGVEGASATIKGLSVDVNVSGAGFVGRHAGGNLANIILDSPIVSSEESNAGIFVGTANNRSRSYSNLVVVNGTLECFGIENCGGLIGYCSTGVTIDSCVVDAHITASQATGTGGLIGQNTSPDTSLTNCYSGVELHSAAKWAGGFIGFNNAAKLSMTNCHFNGVADVSANQGGAFVGRMPASSSTAQITFTNCLNTGVSRNGYGAPAGYSWVGLLAGSTSSTTYMNLTFDNCYSNSAFSFVARNDYSESSKPVIVTFDINGQTKNSFSLNGSATAMSSYVPHRIALSTLPDGFDAEVWSVSEGKNVALACATAYIASYEDAVDLSWFKPNHSITTYAITTTAQLQGLIKLSHLTGFYQNFRFNIDVNDIDYTRTPDGAFDPDFLEEAQITYTLKTPDGKLDADVLKLYVQLEKDATLDDESFRIRFVSSMDGLNCFRGGFQLSNGEETVTYKTKYLYETLSGNRFTDIQEAFCDDSQYYFACVADGFTQADLDTVYTLQGFYEYRTDEDVRSYVYGRSVTFTLRDLLEAGEASETLLKVADEYQIVYPDVQTYRERDMAIHLMELINDTANSSIAISSTRKAAEGKKILLNPTVDDSLTYFDYKISEADGNLVVQSGSEYSLKLAVEDLVALLDDATELTLNGTYSKQKGFFDWSGRTQIDLDTWKPVWAQYNDYTVLPGNEWLHDFEEKAYALTCPTTSAYRLTSKQHRGDMANYPDGSLEGIASSIYAGIDCIETDTRMTRDGVMVLLHDASLARTTNVEEFIGRPGYPLSANVTDWTYEQLQDLNMTMNNGQVTEYKIATLYEVLLLIRGRVFIQVDDKGNQMVKNDSKNLYSISADNNILFDMATDTGSKTSFIYWYGQDGYSDLDKWAQMDPTDTEYINFLNKMKRYDAMSGHDLREDWWPDGRSGYGSGGLVENSGEWLERRSEGKYMIWTEAPTGLCKFIAENYSPVAVPGRDN